MAKNINEITKSFATTYKDRMGAACFIFNPAYFSFTIPQPLIGYEYPDKLALGFYR